jgi:hypothetical protein
MFSGNYSLLGTSPYYRKGSDGKDIGVDMNSVRSATNGVKEGKPSWLLW